MLEKNKTWAVIALMFLFAAVFFRNTASDLPLIFKKDLLAHDESSNSVVAANITRKFFPPMVRVNPLVDEQKIWMEGPYWQHIPPLFAYVPYVFFQLDGEVTIEVKRLSFAFLILLTGLIFIWGVYQYRKNVGAAIAGTVAAIAWVNTPFTHELVTGYAFGVSDIVLAFSVVCSFVAILWYLKRDRGERIMYPMWKLALVGSIVALPIMVKNLLGAIPAATYIILLLWDNKKINKQFVVAATGFLGILLLYYLPLYFASPETFKKEILIGFLHMQDLEGWGRPWHYYFSNYFPQRYLFDWTWLYFIGLILAIALRFRYKGYKTLWLSGIWFAWNLVAVTLIESKIANFVFQSYLLSLYFIFYSILVLILNLIRGPGEKLISRLQPFLGAAVIVTMVLSGYQAVKLVRQFNVHRAQAYDYQSEREKFYGSAEQMREYGINQKDLVIVHVSDNDCWFRYNVLFLTGAEAKTLLEMSFGFNAKHIKDKYTRMYFVTNELGSMRFGEYTTTEYSLADMPQQQIKNTIDQLITDRQADINQDIEGIKKDKTSCQWLVPDEILNAN